MSDGIDATEVGVVAARVMEDLEHDAADGDFPRGVEVMAAMVIYEVRFTGEDGETYNRVGARVTDDRMVIGYGLLHRARLAMDQDAGPAE